MSQNQAAVEEIRAAAAAAVATGRYMVGIFHEKDGHLVCWSKFERFPEQGVDQSLDHLRRRALSERRILTGGFLPDDEELRQFHRTTPPKPGA